MRKITHYCEQIWYVLVCKQGNHGLHMNANVTAVSALSSKSLPKED